MMLFFKIILRIKSLKSYIINVFTVTFDQFNVSLLNKSNIYIFHPIILNGGVSLFLYHTNIKQQKLFLKWFQTFNWKYKNKFTVHGINVASIRVLSAD